MGEAKRRQEALGDKYGKEENLFPWLPLKKSQLMQFYKVTNTVAWIGIVALVVIWLTVRVIGPGLGWWEVY